MRVSAPNGAKGVYSLSAKLDTGAEVNALALHPSGTLVASASADGSWAIHDLATEKPTTLLKIPLVAEAEAGTSNTTIAFHPDGGMVGVGSSDSCIRIFQILTGECVATFNATENGGGGAIASLSFSENGYILASATATGAKVQLWDLRKLTNLHTIELPTANTITAVRFDRSAQFLAVVGTDLRVFLNKTWEELVVVEENAAELTGVAWGVEGKEIVMTGLDRTVRVVAAPAAE